VRRTTVGAILVVGLASWGVAATVPDIGRPGAQEAGVDSAAPPSIASVSIPSVGPKRAEHDKEAAAHHADHVHARLHAQGEPLLQHHTKEGAPAGDSTLWGEEHKRSNTAQAIASQWESESTAPKWTTQVHGALDKVLQEAELPEEMLHSVDCRTTLCRLELRWTNLADAARFSRVARVPGVDNVVEYTGDGATVFFGRPGVELD